MRWAWVALVFTGLAMAAAPPQPLQQSSAQSAAPVLPGVALRFPFDYGSHPQFGIEWWYVTGWLTTQAGHEPLGFQVTFFRVRTGLDEHNPSSFAARQLLIAHCAISDPSHGRLWQDQRIRRAGLGLAEAAVGDTRVWIDDWRLERRAAPQGDRYVAQLQASDFALDLSFLASTPPMRNGEAGFSRKGPSPLSASYYYSEPQLAVSGSILRAGRRDEVSGVAWLDHEWASEYLDPRARGWDWIGINLDDGSALMAFEIRDRQGRRFWAGGSWRDAHGHMATFGPQQVQFTATRRWRSPRTGVVYPVAERVRVGPRRYQLEPLMDDQEVDARLSSGALYWEGAVRAEPLPDPGADARAAPAPAGRGYLELTGYERPLLLR